MEYFEAAKEYYINQSKMHGVIEEKMKQDLINGQMANEILVLKKKKN